MNEERQSKWNRLAVILGVVLLLELGEKMAERFLPIYLMALGGSAVVIGVSNALDNLLGAFYSLPGGYLSDRIGYKKSLILFDIVSMLGYLIVILFPSWQSVLVGAILFTSWSSVSLPAIMSAISKILPARKRTLGVTLHSLIRRFPMALGPVLGGLFISKWGEREGIRLAFTVAFVVAFVAIFAQNYLIEEEPAKKNAGSWIHPLKIFSRMKPDLRRLLVSDILIRYCEQIPYAFVVVWCMKVIGVSAIQFGALTSVEMVTAILVYLPVAYFVEKKGSKKPFIAITFGFFSIFPLVLLFSRSFATLVFAFLVRGLKEFGEPTRKSLILDFAQGENQGALYGGYYLIRDTVVSFAAFLGGFLWLVSPTLNLLTASGFGVLGVYYFVKYCRE